MSKKDLILHKICSYYIPVGNEIYDDSYEIFPPNSYFNVYQLYVRDTINSELVSVLFKIFKMYSIDVLFFYF